MRDEGHDEQRHRRRDRAQAQVEGDHDAEVERVHERAHQEQDAVKSGIRRSVTSVVIEYLSRAGRSRNPARGRGDDVGTSGAEGAVRVGQRRQVRHGERRASVCGTGLVDHRR